MKKTVSRRRSRPTFRPFLESLEARLTPTTYTVSSLADAGAGSLRAAITSVNADTTADVIDFTVAGVIQLTSGALPAITNTVKIDGTTAPEFAGAPVVEIDNHGFAGLTISGPNFSLASLSIVNANGPGLTLEGSHQHRHWQLYRPRSRWIGSRQHRRRVIYQQFHERRHRRDRPSRSQRHQRQRRGRHSAGSERRAISLFHGEHSGQFHWDRRHRTGARGQPGQRHHGLQQWLQHHRRHGCGRRQHHCLQ